MIVGIILDELVHLMVSIDSFVVNLMAHLRGTAKTSGISCSITGDDNIGPMMGNCYFSEARSNDTKNGKKKYR